MAGGWNRGLKTPLADRFWDKVLQGAPDECWPWTACRQSAGYGYVANEQRKMVLAHRVAYELVRGPIPPGLQIDHVCRNRLCVNPSHLEVVTQRENILRGESAASWNARKTHCKFGHLFSPENTYTDFKGWRTCRECRRRDRRGQRAVA